MKAIHHVTEEVKDFFDGAATVANDGRNKYYYLPNWFKLLEDGTFEEIKFEYLPQSVIDIIEANRNY